jgi:hypothetical protein
MPFHFADLRKYGRVTRDRAPNQCPHCGHRITPNEGEYHLTNEFLAPPQLECVFTCSNEDCNHLFVGIYSLQDYPATDPSDELAKSLGVLTKVFMLKETVPKLAFTSGFSNEIMSIGPQFADTYGQAEKAEAYGLTQICGLGYRKALEYLVKDWCVKHHPTEREKILSQRLAQCIRSYIDDPRVSEMANRAAWLGNDEAHYVKLWIDRDIGDLKLLIKLTCNWMENVLLTEKYRSEMVPNSKPSEA